MYLSEIFTSILYLLLQALNNLLVISREDAGAEGILTFDGDLGQMMDFMQRDERIIVLGTTRLMASIVRNSYKRVPSKSLKLFVP